MKSFQKFNRSPEKKGKTHKDGNDRNQRAR